MIGKTPSHIKAVRPLSKGVVCDYKMTEEMVKYFIKKICKDSLVKPRIALCVPSGITNVESNAVIDVAISSGARKVYLIEEPVAAAIGAQIDIEKPNGNLIEMCIRDRDDTDLRYIKCTGRLEPSCFPVRQMF